MTSTTPKPSHVAAALHELASTLEGQGNAGLYTEQVPGELRFLLTGYHKQDRYHIIFYSPGYGWRVHHGWRRVWRARFAAKV